MKNGKIRNLVAFSLLTTVISNFNPFAFAGDDNVPVASLASIPGRPAFVLQEEPGLPEDFIELERQLDECERRTISNENFAKNNPRLIILGNARVGKDAVSYFLARQNLVATRNQRKLIWELNPEQNLGGLEVIHQGIGSPQPGSWYDDSKERVIWSTPGSVGVELPVNDIVNVMSVRHLLTHPTPYKVLLAVAEEALLELNSKTLGESLERMAAIFGNIEELTSAFSVVVTKQNEITDVNQRLRDILEDNRKLLKPKAVYLLEFLVSNPQKVSIFPKPTEEGKYLTRGGQYQEQLVLELRQKIEAAVHLTSPIRVNPETISISFKPESKEFLVQLINTLNNDVTSYLQTTGTQKIINYFTKKIDDHKKGAVSLRQELKGLAESFDNSLAETEEQLAEKLRPIIETDFIARNIQKLKYLQDTLKIAAKPTKDSWVASVQAIMNKVKILAAEPNKGFHNGVLKLDGFLIGISDIESARGDKTLVTPPNTVSEVDIFSWNTLFLDQDLTLNSGKCYFFAPVWNVTADTVNIILKGLPGDSMIQAAVGVDGLPGNPGKNGGHFYGNIGNNFEILKRLKIDISGGRGGDGQKGGAGKKGEDGKKVGAANAVGATQTKFTNQEIILSELGQNVGHEVRKMRNGGRDRAEVCGCCNGTWLPNKGGLYQYLRNVHHESDSSEGIWHHEVTWTFHEVTDRNNGGSNGGNGDNGGNGGKAGKGGLAGTCVIAHSTALDETSLVSIIQQSEAGSPGEGGEVGPGGSAGQNYKGHRTEVTFNWNGHSKSFTHTDEASGPIALAAGSPGSAGTKGGSSKGDATSPDAQPTEEETLKAERATRRQEYSNKYYTLATDPQKQPFMRVFPDLPPSSN